MSSAVTAPTRPRSVDRADRIAFRVVQVIALLVAIAFVLFGAYKSLSALVGVSVHVSVGAWAPLGELGRVAAVDGFYNGAELDLQGLDFGTRALLATGSLLNDITVAAIAVAFAWLCQRLLRADAPFTRALTRLTVFCALVLIILPTVGRFLLDLGTNNAILQLGLHDPLLIGFGFDVTPWIVGIALAVVGELLRRGERLQREVEGLV